MAQIAKVVDVTRSFIPTDPNSFPENLMYTAQEDSPEKEPPVLAIEGYNFLPTSYGYRSYFGLNSKLDIQPLPARCDKVLLFQLANYQNVLIALCEDGIYYAAGTESGNSWTKAVSYPAPPQDTYLQWTYALIENTLYFYRQGAGEVWKLGYEDYTEQSLPPPSPLNLVSFSSFVGTAISGTGTNTDPYQISLQNWEEAYLYNSTSIPISMALKFTGTLPGQPLADIMVMTGLDSNTTETTITANSFPYTTTVTVPPFGQLRITARQNIPSITAIATDPATSSNTWNPPAGYVPVSIDSLILTSGTSILGTGTEADPFRSSESSNITSMTCVFPSTIAPIVHIEVSPLSEYDSYTLYVTEPDGNTVILATGQDITGSYPMPTAGANISLFTFETFFTLTSLYFTLP